MLTGRYFRFLPTKPITYRNIYIYPLPIYIMEKVGGQKGHTKEVTKAESSADSAEVVVKDHSSPETSIVDLQQEISKTVVEFTEKFKYETMRCVNCPILLECSHPKKRLEALKADATKVAKEIYEEEVELDESAENTLRAQNKRDATYRQYIESKAYEVLKNDRCVFERQEILKTLQKFVTAGYDITDPRTNIIINELVGNLLNSGRANKAFTSLGILLKKDTPAGPIYYENPLLKTKMAFSKLIIEATETLDRILKSDDQRKAEKDFTSHLLQALSIRESKSATIIDVETEVIEDPNE